MLDVITVGSSTIDVFVYTEKEELIKISGQGKSTELQAYPLGSKILIKKLFFSWGGGGTNTAVTLSRLGVKTGYFGCLGTDDNGSRVLQLLKKEGVQFVGKRKNGLTGYSVILDSIAHDRTILTYKGLNDELCQKDIGPRIKAKWLYFASMTEKSFKALEALAALAQRKGMKVAFNPSAYLAEKGKDYLSKVLKATSLLVLNKEEAEILVGKASMKSLLAKLCSLGPTTAVITDGKEGAYCYDGKDYCHALAHKVHVVESTGAGDTFAASFLAALLAGKDTKTALAWGIINSESNLMYYGAKEKLLNHKELLAQLRKNPVSIRKF